MKTDPGKIKYFRTREEWRNWLQENFRLEKEVWLVYPKKQTSKIRIEYNDAVEEALCFGWIDSTVKSLNKDHFLQRFTPRRPNSSFSMSNKERIRWLAERQMIHPSIFGDIQSIISEVYVFPADIISAIKNDIHAWQNFQTFSESYKRIRIAYIDGARGRPVEFKKRLGNFIDKTRENKLIPGFGGINKYY